MYILNEVLEWDLEENPCQEKELIALPDILK